jgi:hypothetical protein
MGRQWNYIHLCFGYQMRGNQVGFLMVMSSLLKDYLLYCIICFFVVCYLFPNINGYTVAFDEISYTKNSNFWFGTKNSKVSFGDVPHHLATS